MPSLIDLRRRIRSVKNTQQITKAMKMVSAAKLRRAQDRIVNARPYAIQMQRVLASVASRVDPSLHPLLAVREPKPESKTLVIIVTGDKGLCGSFNTNIIKAGAAFISTSQQTCALELVGRKGRDFFRRRGLEVLNDAVGIFQKLRYQDAQAIAQVAIDAFIEEKVDRVVLIYNEFKSVMTQRVVVEHSDRLARGPVRYLRLLLGRHRHRRNRPSRASGAGPRGNRRYDHVDVSRRAGRAVAVQQHRVGDGKFWAGVRGAGGANGDGDGVAGCGGVANRSS